MIFDPSPPLTWIGRRDRLSDMSYLCTPQQGASGHPVTNISSLNVAWECDPGLVVYYTNRQRAQCFKWTDAADDTPEQLATKFIDHFPELSEQGRGRDEAYARWYSEMLKATEPAGLIFAEDRWVLPDDQMFTIGVSEDVKIPLPPPGEAVSQA
jgi:hypothetical protein